jgi:hypothetical protein
MNKLLDLVEYHKWKCTEVTNNGFRFYASVGAAEIDKKIRFPPNLKKKICIPEDINSFYDQKNKAGVYERLWDLTIMSLCSDIEYFFKGIIDYLCPEKPIKRNDFQNVDFVINKLEIIGYFDFTKIGADISNIKECFQVRHIATHNMGYVDTKFIKWVKDTIFKINEKYIVDEKTYQRFYESYMAILDNISQSLEKLEAN